MYIHIIKWQDLNKRFTMCYQHIYIIVFLRKKQQKQVDRDSCIKYKLMLAYLIVTVSFMHFNTEEIK